MRLTVAAKPSRCAPHARPRFDVAPEPRRNRPATLSFAFWVPWGMSQNAGTARPRLLKVFRFFVFVLLFFAQSAFPKERDMRRVDLYEATMAGWARLDPSQRERFFRAGLKAALRLGPLQFRAWLLRRLRNQPPDDPAAFAISDRHGRAAEAIAFEGGRCRSRDRAVTLPEWLWSRVDHCQPPSIPSVELRGRCAGCHGEPPDGEKGTGMPRSRYGLPHLRQVGSRGGLHSKAARQPP